MRLPSNFQQMYIRVHVIYIVYTCTCASDILHLCADQTPDLAAWLTQRAQVARVQPFCGTYMYMYMYMYIHVPVLACTCIHVYYLCTCQYCTCIIAEGLSHLHDTVSTLLQRYISVSAEVKCLYIHVHCA